MYTVYIYIYIIHPLVKPRKVELFPMSHVYFLQLSNPFNCSLIPQGSGHDQTLDIWSVGILLYEMMVRNSATGMR